MSPTRHQDVDDTIAAISTAPGVGAIAVVRLSGPDALAIAGRVFRGGVTLADAVPRTVYRGHVFSESAGRLDEVLATVFPAPRSYTGEIMVELSCHGGPLPAALVLGALLEEGARPALPGEFTKRAFLAGRIDLSQAEAVAEIVAAKSRAGLKAALSQLDGALSKRVTGLRDLLIEVLAELEARLDFAEDVDEPLSMSGISEYLSKARRNLDELLHTAEIGRLASEGARVVIAGRPNVGKSSLLNTLIGKDRAIVTPVPGTTRDTIEEWVELDGVLLTLADTAGLRPTTDFVEAEGVRRTRALVRESQLVLAVLELQCGPSDEDASLVKELAHRTPVIPVVNKVDLGGDRGVWMKILGTLAASWAGESNPEDRSQRHAIHVPVFTSALTGEGVPLLKDRIVESLIGREGTEGFDAGEMLLTNARHIESLRSVERVLQRISTGVEEKKSEEILAFELGQALGALDEITGACATEDVLEQIFSRFCIGK